MAEVIRGLSDEQLTKYEQQAEAAMLEALDRVMATIAKHLGATRTAAALVAHLPGKHDQATHGRGGGGAPLTGDEAVAAVAYAPSSDRIRAALDDYGGEGPNDYKAINDGLRGGGVFVTEGFSPQQQANVDALDAAMREVPGAPHDLLVYRFARGPGTFGGTEDDFYGPNPRDLTGMTWRDKGFVSTGAGTDWTGTVQITMHIRVPAGTKALSYHRGGRSKTGGLDVDEVLLNRGLTFRVIADRGFRRTSPITGEPDVFSGRDIDVEVVGP